MKTRKMPGEGNLEMARAFQELRRSNATVPKPQRAARKERSRSGQRRAAIERGSW